MKLAFYTAAAFVAGFVLSAIVLSQTQFLWAAFHHGGL